MENRNSSMLVRWFLPAMILALAIFAIGVYLALIHHNWTMLATGLIGIILVLVSAPIALFLESAGGRYEQAQQEINELVTERLQQISVVLNTISDQQLLSDHAKSVAFREKDRDALRRAIREEMGRQDWEAALSLASDMETQFGYRQEADGFREEIRQHRQLVIRKQITEMSTVVDKHCRAEAWTDALREAQRVAHIFPDDPQANSMPQEVENRRMGHKQQLLDSWNDAVARKDIDTAIEILKKLDLYLTPVEAESMQEVARGVFKAKLDNLRTQFSAVVTDHKWNEAIRVGEIIIRDFPNSRIAQEVQETMDALKQRAVSPAVKV